MLKRVAGGGNVWLGVETCGWGVETRSWESRHVAGGQNGSMGVKTRSWVVESVAGGWKHMAGGRGVYIIGKVN